MELHSLNYGSGDPLIILHGLFGSADNWQTVSKRLGQQFHVFALDLRNHGRSPHAPEMNLSDMAGDIAEFLEDNVLPSAHLLGHSLGGKIAMQFALQSPEKVRKLIIVDIAPRSYPPLHRSILDTLITTNLAEIHDRRQADSRLAERIPEPQVRQFLLKNLVRQADGAMAWKFNLPVLNSNYDRLNDAVLEGRTFDGPILFVLGQNSTYVRPEDWSEILRQFPKAEKAVVADAGHWVHADAPASFLQVVLQFLKK